MEVLFKNVTKYDKEEMDRFQKFHKKINEKRYKFMIIFSIIAFIIFFIINIICKNYIGVFGIIVFAIILYGYYFKKVPKDKEENNAKQVDIEYIFEFKDKLVEIKATGVDNKIPYRKFYRIYETKNNFYLYLDKEYAILVNKNGFTKGTVEDFKKFIKNKFKFKYKVKNGKKK